MVQVELYEEKTNFPRKFFVNEQFVTVAVLYDNSEKNKTKAKEKIQSWKSFLKLFEVEIKNRRPFKMWTPENPMKYGFDMPKCSVVAKTLGASMLFEGFLKLNKLTYGASESIEWDGSIGRITK